MTTAATASTDHAAVADGGRAVTAARVLHSAAAISVAVAVAVAVAAAAAAAVAVAVITITVAVGGLGALP